MIAQNPVRPAALRQCGLISRNERSKITPVPWRIDKLEIEGEMHDRPFTPIIINQSLNWSIYLANQHNITEIVREGPHLRAYPQHHRPLGSQDLKDTMRHTQRMRARGFDRMLRRARVHLQRS